MSDTTTHPPAESGLAKPGTLENHDVKLVFYTIVSIRRGFEMIVPGGQGGLIVTENLTDEQFTGMIIARYFKSPCYQDYKDLLNKAKPKNTKLRMFTEPDVKHLRVQFVMAHRWPRQPLEQDRREAEALEKLHRGLGCVETTL
jgi:hypothetical protein